MNEMASQKSGLNSWLLLLFVAYWMLCCWHADAASVRFRDDTKDIYLLKPPALDRRLGASNAIDDDVSLERDDQTLHSKRADINQGKRVDLTHLPPFDHENEVQSFLVLKLPQSYLSKSNRPVPESVQPPDQSMRSTKFTVTEGGFEAEGELDNLAANVGGSSADASESSNTDQNAFTVHRSIEQQFAARILTSRVGREKPTVRVLIWRKSLTKHGRASVNVCIDAYAFHPKTNELVIGHCPLSEDFWPAGACLIDLVLPLKWWAPMFAKSDTDTASNLGRNRFTKVKIGFSAYASTSKTMDMGASDSRSSNYCRSASVSGADSSSSSTVSYVLSSDAQRSLRIFGEVELIYPSEYALLPLDHVVKVLVPTIDYYPGTTFTVPIFIHYEPPKLNNSSIYLLQLRARASGHLRIVGVDDIDSDWTINHNIEDTGTVVTATAFHRSVSLNESWAGEVFVLIVKIEQDTVTAPNVHQRPIKGPPVSAQLTWSIRLVVDSALSVSSDKTRLDKDFVFPEQSTGGTTSTWSSDSGTGTSRQSGETVSTHVNVQPDRIDTLAVIGDDEMVNTAVINGQQISLPIRVISITQGGVIDDITLKCNCIAIDPTSLKVNSQCSSVYVDGTETKSNANAAIGVQYGAYRTVTRYTVWYPEFPVDIWLADPVLHAISGWYIPAGTPSENTANRNRRQPSRRHSKVSNAMCKQKFQESELKIYARFRAVDATTGGQSYLGGAGRKIQLDLTQMARPFLKVKNATVAKLIHTKYATFVEGEFEGRTEIQLKSPIQRHVYGSCVVETANEQVHLRSIFAEVITGLFFHSELKTPYPPIYNLAIYKSSAFFRKYQEGTISITLKYSDGHRTNLDALDAGYYRLYVTTNGSVTLFPGSGSGRHYRTSTDQSINEVDNDSTVFLPVKILTVDDHAENARVNATLFPPSTCQHHLKSDQKYLAFTNIPVEYPRQRKNPVVMQENQKQPEGAVKAKQVNSDGLQALDISNKDKIQTMPTLEDRSISANEHQHQSYGNAPLLASISVSVFAVAGVLFAACAVREGWVTVKTFARSRCRQWRLLVPLNMNVPPLVFTSSRRSRRHGSGRRRSHSSSSTNSVDEEEDGSPVPGANRNRNRRHGKHRRRNSRPNAVAECTESSVVSAENEFVWLRPMSLTSSSSNGPHFGGTNCGGTGTGARSLNGDLERHSTGCRRSLNGDLERKSINTERHSFGGKDNADFVVSENEFLNCCAPRRALTGSRRGSGVKETVSLSSSSSTVSSNSACEIGSKDACVDDEIFTDTDPDVVRKNISLYSSDPRNYKGIRKMSEVVQSYQRGSYILHEGATTLPSGWSGSEDYGSIGSPVCSRNDPKHKNQRHHSHQNKQKHQDRDSATELFVQRLLSARSDPTVHIRPTPTTAAAAAAAVEAAKRKKTNERFYDQKQDQSTPLKNGFHRRPQSVFASQFRASVCSATSSGGASSDIYWDSSTLGMNEAELRDYFNCLRESVT